MKKWIKNYGIASLFYALFCVPYAIHGVFGYESITAWVRDRAKLSHSDATMEPQIFSDICKRAKQLYINQLSNSQHWYGNDVSFAKACADQKSDAASIASAHMPCYVQKIHLAQEDTLYFFGDLHGDVRALVYGLQRLKELGAITDDCKLKEHTYLVFLGDYSDRGPCSVEALYLVLLLKVMNPDYVVLLRGNHEDSYLNEFVKEGQVSLGLELLQKFDFDPNMRQEVVYSLYDFLPVALYLDCPVPRTATYPDGHTWILCCHGGPEVGFCPKDFCASPHAVSYMAIHSFDVTQYHMFANPFCSKECVYSSHEKKRSVSEDENQFLKRHESEGACGLNAFMQEGSLSYSMPSVVQEPVSINDLGFLWNDFAFSEHDKCRYKGCKLTKIVVEALTKRDGLSAIIRGHQHNGKFLDRLQHVGCISLFNNTVYTLISTFSHYDAAPFVSVFARLEFENKEKWKITSCPIRAI